MRREKKEGEDYEWVFHGLLVSIVLAVKN